MSTYQAIISRYGTHFATCDLKCNTMEFAVSKCKDLRAQLPEAEGWKINLMEWRSVGYEVEF